MHTFFTRTLLFFVVQHVYLFWRFHSLLGKRSLFWITLPWFICTGLFTLIFLYLPQDSQSQHIFGNISRIWQGFAYFCMLVFIARDLLRSGGWLTRRFFPDTGRRLEERMDRTEGKCLAFGAVALFALVFTYGMYESANPRLTSLEIPTEKLPADVDHVRIVFVSDLHISPRFGGEQLERVVNLILEQKPDCILLGGDILDDARQGTPGDFGQLSRLRAPLGTFAVLGNHDAFGDSARPAAALRQAGITVLSAQQVEAGPLAIIGVDDPLVSEQKERRTDDPMPLLTKANSAQFTILLDHRPKLRPESIGLFDLQLSGHSHGGQIFLLEPLLRAIYHAPTGFSARTAEQGTSRLFITTGLGFSKRLPIRLLRPPELVVLDIVARK